MIAYVLVAALSFVSGCFARHFVQSKFVPLSNDAQVLRAQVIAHLDAILDKSEIIIRNDAKVFRDLIAGR